MKLIKGNLYHLHALDRPGIDPDWELLARYEGLYGVVDKQDHTFRRLAENGLFPGALAQHQYGANMDLRLRFLIIPEEFIKHFLGESVEKSDLPLYMNFEKLFPAYEEMLKSDT